MIPTDEADEQVRARALALLEDMEECLCEEGHGARFLADGWRVLDELELRLAQLRAQPPGDAVADVVPIQWHRPDSPPTQGGTPLFIHSLDIMRSVAQHAADNPLPPAPDADGARPTLPDLLPRIARIVTGLFGGDAPSGTLLRVIAQAFATLLPLLDRDADSGAEPAGARPVPEPTVAGDARIDILRQTRAARWRERDRAKAELTTRGRSDVPPSVRLPAGTAADLFGPVDEAWNDLFDLITDALELFIVFRDDRGVSATVELLDLLDEFFGLGLAEAA